MQYKNISPSGYTSTECHVIVMLYFVVFDFVMI